MMTIEMWKVGEKEPLRSKTEQRKVLISLLNIWTRDIMNLKGYYIIISTKPTIKINAKI